MDYRETCVDDRWWESIDRKNMTATTKELFYEDTETDEDVSEKFTVQVTFEVCPVCEGKGTHVAPGVDSHGLSADDFAEDPQFAEDYFGGRYDVPCNLCGGATTIPVCQDEKVNKIIADKAEADRDYRREVEAERRMGA